MMFHARIEEERIRDKRSRVRRDEIGRRKERLTGDSRNQTDHEQSTAIQ